MRPIITRNIYSISVVMATALVSLPALSHHSDRMYDLDTTITLEGVVSEFQYSNPHAWLLVDARSIGTSVPLSLQHSFEHRPLGRLLAMPFFNKTTNCTHRNTSLVFPARHYIRQCTDSRSALLIYRARGTLALSIDGQILNLLRQLWNATP